jgi:ATP/maltotriose-dependent transcriptional regulator MalT/DNA-binding SARP family transcriptional activator
MSGLQQIQASLAPAKLTRPATTGSLARERLYQEFDRSLERPIVWVAGPAGSGKTTLVSSYVEARGASCLWYQMDSDDSDLASFFYYLGRAVQMADPANPNELPLLTSEYLQGIHTFSRSFFEELFERLGRPSILVFDDLHQLPEDAATHEALLEGLSRIPEGARVVLVSRSDPPPPYARLRANRRLGIFGWDDLRLTLDEYAEIVRQRGHEVHSGATLEHLHDRMDGWAAGLQLLLESARIRKVAIEDCRAATPDEILDYFAAEVFGQLDRETQEFLLKTSFLPSMTASLAHRLTDHARADRLLAFLHRNNLFTEKRGHSEPIYRYHPLFREFLSDFAADSLEPEERSHLQRRAAALLMEAGEPEEAAGLLREANDHGGLIGLILRHGPSLVTQGRGHTLETWIDGLPPETVEDDPRLLYWSAACRLPSEPAAARELFQRAYALFLRDGNDQAGLLLAWSGAVNSILFGLDDFCEVDPWIASLYDIVGSPDGVSTGDVGDRVVANIYNALAMRQPQHADFAAWEAQALEVARRTNNVDVSVQILANAVFCKTYLGDPVEAGIILEWMKRATGSDAASPLTRIRTIFAEMFLSTSLGFFDRGIERMNEALAMADATGVHVMDLMLLANGARAALNANHVMLGRDLVDRMASYPTVKQQWNQCFYHYLRARIALDEGDLSLASRSVDLALKLSRFVGVCYGPSAIHLLKAEVEHERENEEAASTHLAQARRLAEENVSAQLLLNSYLTEAQLHFDRGSNEDGLVALRQAMALGRQNGHLAPYLCRPVVLADLCARAFAERIEEEYAGNLVERCGLVPKEPPLEVENWPWALKIQTMGHFRLVKHGRPLELTETGQWKPLALLKAVIALGGREVSETRIVDALWPAADGDAAHRAFNTTLHRLRRFLGLRDAIQLRSGRITLDARCCWVDAWAIERLLGQAEKAWNRGARRDEPAGARLTEQALALYRGAFLPEEDEPWTIQLRERLRNRLLRGVERLGHHLEEKGRWREAADRYQKALEVDPFVEEFYQRLMICYQRTNRRSEALAVYERCRQVLDAALGIPPSDRTETILQSLR